MAEGEKEIVEKVRNSFKSGMTRSEVAKKLQAKGYKLDYIDAVISKANRRKKYFLIFLVVFLMIACVGVAVYSLFFSFHKSEMINPLSGFSQTGNAGSIEITPEFLSYLLNEIGAWKLKRNPINMESPMIGFEISGEKYYSVIGNKIETFEGENGKVDIRFVADKTEISGALLSGNPAESVRSSVISGKISVQPVSDEKVLFLKGYLSLYDSLK